MSATCYWRAGQAQLSPLCRDNELVFLSESRTVYVGMAPTRPIRPNNVFTNTNVNVLLQRTLYIHEEGMAREEGVLGY